jgi:hypothetical protein
MGSISNLGNCGAQRGQFRGSWENPKINKEEVPTSPLISKEEVQMLHLQLLLILKMTQVLSHNLEVPATEDILKEEEEIFPVQKV